MYTIVQFSPTGNTAYIANLLGKHLEVESIYALEHTDAGELEKSEHLIILYAIHAFNAPKPVKRFVSKIYRDKFSKISLIGVGCNDTWVNYGASREIRKILNGNGCCIVVDEIIAMPINIIMSFPLSTIKSQLDKANKITLELSCTILEIPFSLLEKFLLNPLC